MAHGLYLLSLLASLDGLKPEVGWLRQARLAQHCVADNQNMEKPQRSQDSRGVALNSIPRSTDYAGGESGATRPPMLQRRQCHSARQCVLLPKRHYRKRLQEIADRHLQHHHCWHRRHPSSSMVSGAAAIACQCQLAAKLQAVKPPQTETLSNSHANLMSLEFNRVQCTAQHSCYDFARNACQMKVQESLRMSAEPGCLVPTVRGDGKQWQRADCGPDPSQPEPQRVPSEQ